MTELFSGKTAIVIGASLGIGLASARSLAQAGSAVVITGRRADVLTQARDRLRAEMPGARIEMSAGDAADETHVKSALAFAHGLNGRLDAVVAVVGEPSFKPLLMREADDVRKELDINFIAPFLAVRHGVPLMTAGGSIVCVSSAAAIQTNWGLAIYSSAKAALERFVRAAAFELGGAGIRVNAVRPGATFGEDRLADAGLAAMAQAFADVTPMRRLGTPEEVAKVVCFLAGSESGWVTGQTVGADGGMAQNSGPDFMDAMYGKDTMDALRAGKVA
jgi:NAD(P)-dependent dehydrogenase (short-subunit alcohol dehydrogenase family)